MTRKRVPAFYYIPRALEPAYRRARELGYTPRDIFLVGLIAILRAHGKERLQVKLVRLQAGGRKLTMRIPMALAQLVEGSSNGEGQAGAGRREGSSGQD